MSKIKLKLKSGFVIGYNEEYFVGEYTYQENRYIAHDDLLSDKIKVYNNISTARRVAKRLENNHYEFFTVEEVFLNEYGVYEIIEK